MTLPGRPGSEGTLRASEGGAAGEVAAVLRRTPSVMTALRAARAVGAPDWLIAAGAIRDPFWDALHGRPPGPLRDIDVVYFDPDDLTPARDTAIEAALRAEAPDLPWEARNQAAVHVWYPRVFGLDVAPLTSSAEGVATFPEIASAVGARLLEDDDILVVAPHGLDDLLGGVCRHNPVRAPAEIYERRVAEKGWRERWPRMRYVPSGGDGPRGPAPA